MSVEDLRFIQFLCMNLSLSHLSRYITSQKNVRWLATCLKDIYERLDWGEEWISYLTEQIKILDDDIEEAERKLTQIEKEYDGIKTRFVGR